MSTPDIAAETDAGVFPQTQWSIVLRASNEPGAEGRAALEALCRRYWYPLYAYLRRTGHPHHAAEDCTQDFLAHLLAGDAFHRARPERGRFRTYLLSALRNFLINEWHRGRAKKRGAGVPPLPLEMTAAGERYALEPASPDLPPEQLFDRHWAVALIEQALDELRADYAGNGRGRLFEELEPLLWRDDTADTHAVCAARLGLQTHAVTVALGRLRHRTGERLRRIVAETVADGSDIDAELKHLLACVGR